AITPASISLIEYLVITSGRIRPTEIAQIPNMNIPEYAAINANFFCLFNVFRLKKGLKIISDN
ncbi:MAG: hypothetical protein KAT38_07745, partial [Bacteroidales bacterium]|nr:hypothetical protein [Bacteroidales bacterium]